MASELPERVQVLETFYGKLSVLSLVNEGGTEFIRHDVKSCARDQQTTQFCREAMTLASRVVAMEKEVTTLGIEFANERRRRIAAERERDEVANDLIITDAEVERMRNTLRVVLKHIEMTHDVKQVARDAVRDA